MAIPYKMHPDFQGDLRPPHQKWQGHVAYQGILLTLCAALDTKWKVLL